MATAPAPNITSSATAQPERSYAFEMTVLTSLFFMWGFITCLNDILIPHLKRAFDLNYVQTMLIQFTFFTAYFIMSLPSGTVVKKVGYRRGIVIGLAAAGVGCLLFYPAAGTRSYPLFLSALFVLASGITLLQVAANPYVSILGPPSTASSRLNLSQALNSLGTTIAPFLGSIIILSAASLTTTQFGQLNAEQQAAYKVAEASSVQVPYLVLMGVLFLIAGLFAVIHLPNIEASTTVSDSGASYDSAHKSAWGYRHLVLGAIGIFVYVGAEVSIGSFLVNYLNQPYIAGLKEADAGKFVSLYWGGAMIGRFFGAIRLAHLQPLRRNLLLVLVFLFAIALGYYITRDSSETAIYVGFVAVNLVVFLLAGGKPGKTLSYLAFGAAALVIMTMVFSGAPAMWTVLSVGLFNSIMFPVIFTLAIEQLGRHTGQGSGILCMAIVGGALIPITQGYFADTIGIHHAFFLPVLCYLYIAYYGLKGHVPVAE
ncbi:MAG TPA: sugar MFS transporter [Bacteroidota bacterium]|nr:sugar MFS transporter [Bacteroidota bacterium]